MMSGKGAVLSPMYSHPQGNHATGLSDAAGITHTLAKDILNAQLCERYGRFRHKQRFRFINSFKMLNNIMLTLQTEKNDAFSVLLNGMPRIVIVLDKLRMCMFCQVKSDLFI